ncbi:MAG: protein kinase domain-containing protein [Candidatus Anammoxibacter sp.]
MTMYRLGKYQFEGFKYRPGHRANYAVLTESGNREWGMKYSPSYSYSSEHDVLKNFSHPQIPLRNDCGMGELFDNDKLVLKEHFIVLQHFEGEDIVQYYKDKGVPDSGEMGNILKYFSSVTDPLNYLHVEKKHVHTDLKPGHLILNLETETVALIDLELSIKSGEIIKGMTKEYASPEQKQMIKLLQALPEDASVKEEKKIARQIDIDGRADLYTIGLIMFEVLTGKLWVESKQPPITINNDIPQKLNDIVIGLLEEEPDNRVESASKLKDALAAV